MRKEKSSSNFIVIGILFFVSVLFLFWGLNLYFENKKFSQKLEILIKRADNLEKENQRLKEELEKLQSESYWEEKARERGYKKEGEQTIIIQK
jgi:cell division protein FtsB